MARRRKPKKKKRVEAEKAPEPEVEAEASPPTAAQSSARKHLWLVAVIGAVVAAMVYVEIGNGDSNGSTSGVHLEGPPPAPEDLTVRVVHRYPHDVDAFTQGLLWHEGELYESTGLRGESSLRRVALETGEVLERRSVDSRLFAEGLARVDDELFQLTWEAGQVHVWDIGGFQHRRRYEYDGEGWGLCHDGEHLVMSDGSERLTFRQPDSFRVDHVVRVRDDDGFVENLNELECVDGVIWANVWQTDRIVRIDPGSGRVTASVDASGLLDLSERIGTDVLNGIAWIPEREHFVITGKLWPWLFEVEFVEAD